MFDQEENEEAKVGAYLVEWELDRSEDRLAELRRLLDDQVQDMRAVAASQISGSLPGLMLANGRSAVKGVEELTRGIKDLRRGLQGYYDRVHGEKAMLGRTIEELEEKLRERNRVSAARPTNHGELETVDTGTSFLQWRDPRPSQTLVLVLLLTVLAVGFAFIFSDDTRGRGAPQVNANDLVGRDFSEREWVAVAPTNETVDGADR